MDFLTQSAGETQKLAGKILKEIASHQTQGALVLALQGELGAGKTAFTQGLGQALGIKEKILSPTFVIMKHFKIATSDKRLAASRIKVSDLYHIDAYRLSGIKDTKELGLEEILKDKNNLVVIEWAERVKEALPKDAVWIKFEHKGEDNRGIKVLFPEQGA